MGTGQCFRQDSMKNYQRILLPPDTSIREAIRLIDSSAMQIVLVVDGSHRLLGTVTDGDVRRGILKGISLEDRVEIIMNSSPLTRHISEDRETVISRMRAKKIRHLPVVDDNGFLVELETFDELFAPTENDNLVVLMAGGLGVRLRPLTENCPKPMLKIGGRPILENILLNFIEYGFRRFFIAVNYRADVVKSHFGNGSTWGVEIRYLNEDRRLGTAGALSLIPEKPSRPIFVMNGDLMTKVNFVQLLDFHSEHKAKATMCVREYDFQVPYGVVKIDRHNITAIEEKPVQRMFVNAGIYVLEPETLDNIPPNIYFDMPTLFERMISSGYETVAFPIREYWLDIGHMEDFERANAENLDSI